MQSAAEAVPEPTPIVNEVIYMCGQCGANNAIKPQDIIRCRDCGYRILYKVRTKRRRNSPCIVCLMY